MKAATVILVVIVLAGCGGSDPQRITGQDKDRISEAALTIAEECFFDGDEATIENAVNDLLNAQDEFGDQRFTISDTLRDVTVQDVIDQQAELMREEDCSPTQRKRLGS